MEEPLLAQLYSDSVQGRISSGPKEGRYHAIAGCEPDLLQSKGRKVKRSANMSGFSLHANVCIPANPRRQLENLCRYVAKLATLVPPPRFNLVEAAWCRGIAGNRMRKAAAAAGGKKETTAAKIEALFTGEITAGLSL